MNKIIGRIRFRLLQRRLLNCPKEKLPLLLKKLFHARTGKMPTDDFTDFNDKIVWAMMFDATALKAKCADKYRAREYVAEKIGNEYLPELHGVWDSPDEIDIAGLPEKFIFQFNTGTGKQKIVPDKSVLDMGALRDEMRKWFTRHYWTRTCELQYRVPYKVIARELLDIRLDREFRLYCFDGKVEFIMHRSYEKGKKHIGLRYYSRDWSGPGFTMAGGGGGKIL